MTEIRSRDGLPFGLTRAQARAVEDELARLGAEAAGPREECLAYNRGLAEALRERDALLAANARLGSDLATLSGQFDRQHAMFLRLAELLSVPAARRAEGRVTMNAGQP